MTPTSDERRDIAARLRALPIDTYAVRKEWEEGGLFIDANLGDEADYSQIHNAVFGCFPAEYMHAGDYEELHERLADLIDPCPSMADEQMGKLRRRSTALASMTRIASDMSGWAGELADSCERMSRARIADDVRRFADRIRQEARDALN